MKKSLILAGMLCIGYATAQEYDGRVGINTETPSATLEVKSKGNSISTNSFSIRDKEGITSLRVTDDRKLLIGFPDAYIPTGSSRLRVLNDAAGSNPSQTELHFGAYDFSYLRRADNVNAAMLTLQKGRGSYDAPQFIQSGDNLGRIRFRPAYIQNIGDNTSSDGAYINVRTSDVTDELHYSTTLEFATRASTNEQAYMQMVLNPNGYLGIGTQVPTERLEVNGNAKITGLKGTGDRAVYADENGILKIGTATATSPKALNTEDTCTATNAGTFHYKEREVNGQQVGTMGFCTRQNGTYTWVYFSNGANVLQSAGTNKFGEGL